MLQLLLLFIGTRRRRRISVLLRFILWLSYGAADPVAVFAMGLFRHYEENYKLRSHNSSARDHMLPFLWVPFLLLHLGGQDTITAFSVEDNNLWQRHLQYLVIQVSIAMYVFWKSFDILDSQLLTIAVHIFVAGIIKYGERMWALERGSRDSLRSGKGKEEKSQDHSAAGDVKASYARKSVLQARGLLVGRTMPQLGEEVQSHLVSSFAAIGEKEGKLEIVMMELRMIYDILYTKAMVLQSRTGMVLRCGAIIAMGVAFGLFMSNQELHGHNKANVAITYALFVGAIFTEFCSVYMLTVSPWISARTKKGSFLCWLAHTASTKGSSCPSMGQFNLIDYSLSEKSMPKLSKVVAGLGLEKQWRNSWHIKHVEDKRIIDYLMGLFDNTGSGRRFQQLELGRELNYLLSLPFEHALVRLHIFTDMHISRHLLGDGGTGLGHAAVDEMTILVAECKKISNYLMYLMVVYPSMLPVSSAAQDIEPIFTKWVRDNHRRSMTKTEILEKYANQIDDRYMYSASPFRELPSVESFREVKELWARLLLYAAGKCPMELHARQLSDGGELLTVVALLMMHHGLGDVGREFNLLASGDPRVPPPGSLVSADQSTWIQRSEGPLYAFDFHQHAFEYDHQTSSHLQPTQELPRLFVRAWAPGDMFPRSSERRQAECSTPDREQTDSLPSETEQVYPSRETDRLNLPQQPQPQQVPSQPNTSPETDLTSEAYLSSSEIAQGNRSSEIQQLDVPTRPQSQEFALQPNSFPETAVAPETEQKQADGALEIELADVAPEIEQTAGVLVMEQKDNMGNSAN